MQQRAVRAAIARTACAREATLLVQGAVEHARLVSEDGRHAISVVHVPVEDGHMRFGVRREKRRQKFLAKKKAQEQKGKTPPAPKPQPALEPKLIAHIFFGDGGAALSEADKGVLRQVLCFRRVGRPAPLPHWLFWMPRVGPFWMTFERAVLDGFRKVRSGCQKLSPFWMN